MRAWSGWDFPAFPTLIVYDSCSRHLDAKPAAHLLPPAINVDPHGHLASIGTPCLVALPASRCGGEASAVRGQRGRRGSLRKVVGAEAQARACASGGAPQRRAMVTRMLQASDSCSSTTHQSESSRNEVLGNSPCCRDRGRGGRGSIQDACVHQWQGAPGAEQGYRASCCYLDAHLL